MVKTVTFMNMQLLDKHAVHTSPQLDQNRILLGCVMDYHWCSH